MLFGNNKVPLLKIFFIPKTHCDDQGVYLVSQPRQMYEETMRYQRATEMRYYRFHEAMGIPVWDLSNNRGDTMAFVTIKETTRSLRAAIQRGELTADTAQEMEAEMRRSGIFADITDVYDYIVKTAKAIEQVDMDGLRYVALDNEGDINYPHGVFQQNGENITGQLQTKWEVYETIYGLFLGKGIDAEQAKILFKQAVDDGKICTDERQLSDVIVKNYNIAEIAEKAGFKSLQIIFLMPE